MLIYLSMIESPEDRDWFAAMYQKNAKVMKEEANKILKDEGEAENATHDAFISIAKHITEYNGKNDDEMRGLCIVIVRNRALDILKKRNALPISELEEEIVPWVGPEDPENIVVGKEQSKHFRDLLNKLPDKPRSVLVLKCYYGYSNGEIARLLGMSKKSVEMNAYRGRKQLEELLRKEGYHG